MAGSAQDFARSIQQTTENIKEYRENIRSPWVPLAASVAISPALVLPFWPIDVLKTHLMAGKGAALGIKRHYSAKGLGFGMLGATVLGFDITSRYIQQYGHEFSFTKKALIGLAPLSLIPVASILESLKINAQISQTPMKQCFHNVIQTAGYKGLLRGIVPYSSLFLVTYCSIALPMYYHQKPDQNALQDMEPVLLNPAIVLSALLVATPLDVLKTKAMLGEKITVQSLKMCPKQLAGLFLLRTAYVCAFGYLSEFFGKGAEKIVYDRKVERYQFEKRSKYFAKDDEFDGLISENLENLDSDSEFLKKILMK